MEIKEDAENLASSIGVLLTALESDEEVPKEGEEVKQNEKTYEIEDVRKILADKSRLGHTAKIRELLEKYGAKKLSEIEPSNYKDLVADVEKLQWAITQYYLPQVVHAGFTVRQALGSLKNTKMKLVRMHLKVHQPMPYQNIN